MPAARKAPTTAKARPAGKPASPAKPAHKAVTATTPVRPAAVAAPAPAKPAPTGKGAKAKAAGKIEKADKGDKAEKARKPKLVRDSFTIPKPEYAVLQALKERAARLGRPAKKSELLRAGVKALAGLGDAAFGAALAAVPALKTGRPAKA